MGESACFMRKMFVFAVGDCCKWCCGMVLESFGNLRFSKIVQTESMSFLASSAKCEDYFGFLFDGCFGEVEKEDGIVVEFVFG